MGSRVEDGVPDYDYLASYHPDNIEASNMSGVSRKCVVNKGRVCRIEHIQWRDDPLTLRTECGSCMVVFKDESNNVLGVTTVDGPPTCLACLANEGAT